MIKQRKIYKYGNFFIEYLFYPLILKNNKI